MRIGKKAAALLAAAVFCAALAGCGSDAASSMGSSGATSESASEEASDGETGGGMDGEAASGSTGQDGTGGLTTASPEPGDMTDSGNGAASTPAASGTAPTPKETAVHPTSLNALLDECISYEAGSAGGSLKTAKAAAGLVELFSTDAPSDLAGDAAAWRQGLDAGQESTLQQNWPGISQQARAIADDPAATAGLLATAGVTTDFTGMDLSGIPGCMDALDEAFQPQK